MTLRNLTVETDATADAAGIAVALAGLAKLSLNDEIAAAESESQIQDLLMQGRAYRFVSNRTMNRWQRTAKRRRLELKGK